MGYALSSIVNLEVGSFEALTVYGNGMLPYYRHGDLLLVSKDASLKVGDRVVVKTNQGKMVGGVFVHRDRDQLVVSSGNRKKPDASLKLSDVNFLGRVMWASQ